MLVLSSLGELSLPLGGAGKVVGGAWCFYPELVAASPGGM